MRGLSTTQQTVRLSVASVEMTLLGGWREAQPTAKTTADPYGMTTIRTGKVSGQVLGAGLGDGGAEGGDAAGINCTVAACEALDGERE